MYDCGSHRHKCARDKPISAQLFITEDTGRFTNILFFGGFHHDVFKNDKVLSTILLHVDVRFLCRLHCIKLFIEIILNIFPYLFHF